MKKVVKIIISFILHPILMLYLTAKGSHNVFIKPQTSINKLRYLEMGNNIQIGRSARFLFVKEYYGGSYEPRVIIGNNVSIGNRFSALSAAPITISDDCLIASDVLVTSENHGMDIEASSSYATIPLDAKPVVLGNGCWIGEKVSIMPGVTLGDRCIVAANSVVTKSFPEACLIGGIPARIIKRYDYKLHSWVRE